MMARPLTPHYSIPQYGPQGTADPMAVYSVYNPAMKVIDDILWAFKERMDGLEQRVASLEGRMDQAEADIVNLGDRITQEVATINQTINQMKGDYDATIADIVNKFYGGGSVGDDGHVSWGDSGKAAVGNMNVYAGGADASAPNALRTRADGGENDVQVI